MKLYTKVWCHSKAHNQIPSCIWLKCLWMSDLVADFRFCRYFLFVRTATLAKGPCIHPDPRISGLCARKKCSYITDWKCLWNRWPLLNAKFWSKTGRRQIMNRTKVTQKNIAQTIVFLSKWKLNFILKSTKMICWNLRNTQKKHFK